MCRGGYFLLHNRESPSPGSLSNIKNSAVLRRENISKKNGEMSCNFGEIIKKLYLLVWWKARQRATHATPHLSASRYRTFSMCWTASENRKCEIYLRESLAGGGRRAGWFAKRCHSITDHQIHQINCKLKTKKANTILLLCYLYKICLILTGGLWQALANLYSGGRL